MTPRRAFLVAFVFAVLPCLAVACAQLSAADQATIAADTVRISVCQAETAECKRGAGDAAAAKCWPVYDDCMIHAGLKDGGIQ